MFTAVNGHSFRDGVFSHASPGQSYESSVRQYHEGSLGASRRGWPRSVRGMGRSFRDGVLGDDSSSASTTSDTPTQIIIGPNGASIGPTPAPAVPFYKQPAVIACGAIAIVAAYFLYKKK